MSEQLIHDLNLDYKREFNIYSARFGMNVIPMLVL